MAKEVAFNDYFITTQEKILKAKKGSNARVKVSKTSKSKSKQAYDKPQECPEEERILQNYECLLIETQGRKLFTEKKYLYLLIPAAKKFQLTLSYVKAKEVKILELEKLVESLKIDGTQDKIEYEILVQKFPKKKVALTLNQSSLGNIGPTKSKDDVKKEKKDYKDKIRTYIETEFLNGHIVNYEKISMQFPDLTKSAASTQIRYVKNKLADKKITIKTIKKGVYEADCNQLMKYH